ncbi:MAG: hypothetical protein K2L46_05655, partial [Paramuribaculum sp.]|nr:hypothetical protein [Paramuribaculum sp.]
TDMRNILIVLVCFAAISVSICVYGRTSPQDDSWRQDSTVNVIGWFNKHDTLVYWINESNWQLSPTDTVKTSGVSTKVRLTVVDSTANGYKMDYTFLEFRGDSVGDSGIGNFQNRLVDKLGRRIIGTTINFETDELGAITKFNNLGKIKRQAKSLFKEAMKELMGTPEIAGLKDFGLDLSELVKDVDSDELVDGYLEELKLLFLCHGLTYGIGEFHSHVDANETVYENDTYTTVRFDPSDDTYSITTDVINIIPRDVLKDMVGGIVESMNSDSITQSFRQEFDSQVREEGVYESYFSSDYLAHGWPYRVVKQSTTTIDGRGKSKQTYIYLDYINY